MIDYKTIGAKIRKRRINCNLSQERLAEMCDVGTTHISHIETGNCIPSLKVFIGIINVLDCSSHELMIITDTIQALKSSLRK
jgi:transcriptional regulator with XRE-family HTH domain